MFLLEQYINQETLTMTKERVCANNPTMSRRILLTALPVAGASLALPSSAQEADSKAILEVIRELEDWKPWEISSVVAAKLYAANRIREALDLETPFLEDAWRHINYQAATYDGYIRASRYRQATA
ncbi:MULTISPECIES: hypothetical protein [Sulfitobacter]|uniref:hypothetical protein n=2 Tax=Sulfitobacter TaxID=60136 RepID=UPI0000668F49|nr:hypothetical protein EE36_03263 [Sulfitobacter sp. EE-36]